MYVGDADHSGSVTIQPSTNKRKNDIHHLSSVCSNLATDKLTSVGNTSQLSSDVCLARKAFANARRGRGGSRRGRPRLSDLNTGTQSTSAVLEHPRRSSAGVKRKLSPGKCVQVQVQHAYLVRPLQLDRWRMTIKTYGKKNN